jgi:hypothetical protein
MAKLYIRAQVDKSLIKSVAFTVPDVKEAFLHNARVQSALFHALDGCRGAPATLFALLNKPQPLAIPQLFFHAVIRVGNALGVAAHMAKLLHD